MSGRITIKQCVEFAINTENEMSEYYAELAKQCDDDKEMEALFNTLASDEIAHKTYFEKLLKDVENSEQGLSPEENDFLRAMSLSKSFSEVYGRKDQYYNKGDREKLLFDIFEFEKATLGFYIALMEILGENKALKEIIRSEKAHVVAVMKSVVTGSKHTSMGDRWP